MESLGALKTGQSEEGCFRQGSSADQPAAAWRNIAEACVDLLLAHPQLPDQAHIPDMGNSGSTSLIIPTPRKLSWGRQKEDCVKLQDLMTQCEEDLWRVKQKQRLSVKKVRRTRSAGYADLTDQERNSFHPKRGEMLNPAFVGDQGLWMN
ncbi:unnamed protein product [Pleuronectes platessa]|uniref:Uncharacterized protein n=1 Tax=Pleuronectes platessa TaxID=8262 RepID=A0A9N7YAE3_PLEPL|nr:unnamed protein product [Pleuronectes platessa]